MPNIRRIRFATKGPAVMPQKILTDTRGSTRSRASSSTAASCTRKSCSTRTSTTRTRSPGSPQAAMNKLFERGHHGAQPDRAAARRQRLRRDDEPAGQAARPRQRAPLLRLHARPGEGRRGPAHDAADRRSTSRSTCAARRPGFNTPTFVVDAPGGGGKRDVHSYEHYDRDDRRLGLPQPQRRPRTALLLLRSRSTSSARGGSARWADPAEHDTMIDEATAAALANAR